MKKYALLLGKTPDLSIAELECLLPKIEIAKNTGVAFVIDLPGEPQKFLDRLGGSLEILEIFTEKIPMNEVEAAIEKYLKEVDEKLSGKCNFALSLIPERKNSSTLKFLLPRIKKSLRADGIKANFMNNNFQNVSPVLAKKQKLVEDKTNIGIIDLGEGMFSLGSSVALQDFEAYSKRDYGKPARDANVGMLPPKLAQMMVNLGCGVQGTGDSSESYRLHRRLYRDQRSGLLKSKQDCSPFPVPRSPFPLIFDPFCGTGTILMEAMPMGYSVVGSDSDPKMVAASKKNLDWLRQNFKIAQNVESEISQSDATSLRVPPPFLRIGVPPLRRQLQAERSNLAIVTEPHLGPPLSTFPAENFLKKVMDDLSNLYLGFFGNLAKWLPVGSPVVFIFPYWKRGNEKVRLSINLIEKIEALGFKQNLSLFYERIGQIVGREIVRLDRSAVL